MRWNYECVLFKCGVNRWICCALVSFLFHEIICFCVKRCERAVIYSFGRNFLACVTKAASVHTLEGCSVLWIMGVSFEEPSLPCTGTLGALACEKGGNKVVKFAQSTPPPPPAPLYSSPVFPTQHEVKDRTDARHLTNTSDDSCACIGHREHIYNLINTNQSNVHGFLRHLTPKYVVSCINWLD